MCCIAYDFSEEFAEELAITNSTDIPEGLHFAQASVIGLP